MSAIRVGLTQGCAISLSLGAGQLCMRASACTHVRLRNQCRGNDNDYVGLILSCELTIINNCFMRALSHICMLYCMSGISRDFGQIPAQESSRVMCCYRYWPQVWLLIVSNLCFFPVW